MLLTSTTLAALLIVAQAPVPLASSSDRFIASAAVGRGSTWDDEGGIGPGWFASGGLEWRVVPRLSVVFDVERLPHRRDTPGLQFNGRTVFASAGVKYRFAAAGVTPYVEGGAGMAQYSGDLVVRFEPPPVTVVRSSTSSVVHAAAGIEIPIAARLVVAPEVRIRLCQPNQDFAPWSTLTAGVRVGFKF